MSANFLTSKKPTLFTRMSTGPILAAPSRTDLRAFRRRQVRRDAVRLAAPRQRRHGVPDGGVPAPVDDHPRAFRDEGLGDGAPDALRRARHQREPAL